jgi:hypothetical protein
MRMRIREAFDPGSGMKKIRMNIPDPQHCFTVYKIKKASFDQRMQSSTIWEGSSGLYYESWSRNLEINFVKILFISLKKDSRGQIQGP